MERTHLPTPRPAGDGNAASKSTKFKILSLDGGGIRGAFTASCLAEMERRLGGKDSIARYFDLLAGTSTGGIIAVALSLGMKAAEIEALYHEHGEAIFRPRPRKDWPLWKRPFVWGMNWVLHRKWGLDMDKLQQSRYLQDELQAALRGKLQKRTIGEARSRLVVPSVDLTRGQTVVFKTPHLPYMIRDRYYEAVDVILATTAAPTYFPHATIKQGVAQRHYTDGGLWANNPSMVALVEAGRIAAVCDRPVDPLFGLNDIHLLSIGTGFSTYSLAPPEEGPGLGWWASRLIDVMSISQAQGVDFQVRHVLRDRYHRIDFPIPGETWSLDAVGHLNQLLGIGKGKAEEHLAKLIPHFFAEEAAPYVPYPDDVAMPADRAVGGEAQMQG